VASQTEIANRALTKLGATRITSITENSKGARVMNAIYDTVRQAELRKRNWSFALARTSLPKLGAAPDWGYANQYQLPTDYLRLTQVNDIYVVPSLAAYVNQDNSPYAIEGRAILTDFGAPLKIRYVRDITDTGLFDALFVEAFASKLAYEACEEITNSNTKREAAANDYKACIRDAGMTNAIERPPQSIPDDSWTMGRL
jgi:hypothetical protein